MRKLWTIINHLNIEKDIKNGFYLAGSILINALIGFIIWLFVGMYCLSEVSWMLCFVGYPAMFGGFFRGILFLYNNDFD